MQCWMWLDPGISYGYFSWESLGSPWCGQEHPNPTGMEPSWGWEKELCAHTASKFRTLLFSNDWFGFLLEYI